MAVWEHEMIRYIHGWASFVCAALEAECRRIARVMRVFIYLSRRPQKGQTPLPDVDQENVVVCSNMFLQKRGL